MTDALLHCDAAITALAREIESAVANAVDGAPPCEITAEEAAAVEGLAMKLQQHKASEKARLAPSAARVQAAFGTVHKALDMLCPLSEADIEQRIKLLAAQDAQLSQAMVAKYAEAAELADRMDTMVRDEVLTALECTPA